MRRTLAIVVLVASLLVAGPSRGAQAVPNPTGVLQPIDLDHIDPGLVRAVLEGTSTVTVMLELKGASIAERQAEVRASGGGLSTTQRDTIRAEMVAGQDRVTSAVAAHGGQVLSRYEDAYHGVKISIPASELASVAQLPEVAGVHRLERHARSLTKSVPYIAGPAAWTDAGASGEGTTIAVIDTGLDYTHADFGGPGTPEAYETNDPTVIEEGTFPTAKVVAGFDFAGDDYDADGDLGSPVPSPDPDPLDCDGHGSHVAGIAAGQGVAADGTTYAGPYDTSVDFTGFNVGPGVAPQADLVALKVFGCEGSTDLTVDAIERAAELDVDVINMSLGGVFGTDDDPSAVATNNVAAAGIVVVTSAGNEGPSGYMVGAPGAATRALATAALDVAQPELTVGTIDIDGGLALSLSNSGSLPVTGEVDALLEPDGDLSLGCDPAEYAGTAGKIVITLRGTCDRVDRAENGQAAGAAAVVMVNNAPNYPPFEGDIPGVTIPFLGALASDEAALVGADGEVHTITPTSSPNPGYKALATFTAGGPRNGDNLLKPDVTAPGVAIVSAGVGTGNGPATISGTSQASPHNAGVAALVREVHTDWTAEQVKAAIMNTADTSSDTIQAWDPRLAGSGVTRADRAVQTVGLATTGPGQAALSYGYEPLGGAYSEAQSIILHNTGSVPIIYDLSSSFAGESFGANVRLSARRVTVPAGGAVTVGVTLRLSAAEVASLPSADVPDAGLVTTIGGSVVATPVGGGAGVYPLTVPFLVTPRGLSDIVAGPLAPYVSGARFDRSRVELRNRGIHAGTADVYAWGLSDPAGDAFPGADLRNVGVQAFPQAGGDAVLVFAVAFEGTRSTASVSVAELGIDTDHDGQPNFTVLGVDSGALTAGGFNGIHGSFVLDADGNVVAAFNAIAPTQGSVVLLPLLASNLGLGGTNSTFRYSAVASSLEIEGPSDTDVVARLATFDFRHPALSNGDFIALDPGAYAILRLSVDRAAFAGDGGRGWMVVTLDDANGGPQVETIRVGSLPPR